MEKRDIFQALLHIFIYRSRKGEFAVKIIVHYPETPEKQTEFDARVAKFHADYVVQYIEKLNCPTDQKLNLLDAVAQTILKGAEGKRKNNI